MPENGPSGSEGGGAGNRSPYPYSPLIILLWHGGSGLKDLSQNFARFRPKQVATVGKPIRSSKLQQIVLDLLQLRSCAVFDFHFGTIDQTVIDHQRNMASLS